MTKRKYFNGDVGGAAFSDPQDNKKKIDWKSLMFQYPKNHGDHVDFKILTDPRQDEWNKRLLVHPFMKTIDSFGAAKEDIKWLGTKKCNGMESREVIHCEYCRFIVEELDKITKIVSTLYKNKYDEDMTPSDFGKLVADLDKQAEKNSKLSKFQGILKRYRELTGCAQTINKYVSVYVKGQGVKLMETRRAIDKFIKDRQTEKVDVTQLWIRVENNKNGGNPQEYYKVYKSNNILEESEGPPTQSQLQGLVDSQIKEAFKSLTEHEDKERQLKNLAGDFGNQEEKEEEKEFDYKEEEVVNMDDLDSLDSLTDDTPSAEAVTETPVETTTATTDTVEEDDSLDIDALIDGDDLLADDTSSTEEKSESIPIRPEESTATTDSSDEFDLDEDLQSLDDLINDVV